VPIPSLPTYSVENSEVKYLRVIGSERMRVGEEERGLYKGEEERAVCD
jgi:hypothetical protein